MKHEVVILSGVSGSGKSTYAEKLLNETQGIKVSADHYFMWDDGTFHFDASKLSEAHADCFRRFLDFCQKDINPIVVDNTNIETWEISPYVLAASTYGYDVTIITMDAAWHDLYVLCNRNVHGVPLRTLETQYRILKSRNLPLWWRNIFVPVTL